MNESDLIRRTVFALQAQREHSRFELLQKLKRKQIADDQQLLSVLRALETEGVISDQRFAESYVRYRSNRGFGPKRLVVELKIRGIDAGLIQQSVHQSGVDWRGVIERLWWKKYGSKNTHDQAEHAEDEMDLEADLDISELDTGAIRGLSGALQDLSAQLRFFTYRGFALEDIRAVFAELKEVKA